LGVIWSSLTGY